MSATTRTTSLPRSTPAEQDVDAVGLLGLLDALAAAGVEMHSLMVLRHGRVLTEGWWAPYAADSPHLLYSLSKSFTSTAAGIAAGEGLLDLDDTVLSHFPELDADVTDPRSRAMKIRHIAAMASGHEAETLPRAIANDPLDPVRGFLMVPPDREPGTVFAYNQPCTFTLGAIVQRHTGQSLSEYLRPRLFEPLGIGEVGWQRHGELELGFTGLHARTEDVAKLGQLYLQDGVWEGIRLLPTGWVAQATRQQIANPAEPNPDWRQGYGFQFWVARHGYRGDGAYGQFCVVLPEQDVVLASTACTGDMQVVLDAVWQHLLPAVDRPAGEPGAEAELADRMASLALPSVTGSEQPGDLGRWSGAFTLVADPPADDERPLADQPVATLTGVRLEAGAGLRLVLVESGDELGVEVGLGEWISSAPQGLAGLAVPVAASAGWLDAGTLQVEVVFTETPHRIAVVLDAAARTARVRWLSVPLRPVPLGAMCAASLAPVLRG